MKALTWHGKNDIRCDTVPDPKIQDGRDAIIKVTACAICGSDLHLYHDAPTGSGIRLGHEAIGTVAEVGPHVHSVRVSVTRSTKSLPSR